MSFAALKALMGKIEGNQRAADAARDLPNVRARTVAAILMRPGNTYPATEEAQKIIFYRMRDAAIEEERAAGVVARDRELKRLATELDGLRAELPALAAAARFELLDTVVEMRTRPNGKDA